MTPERRSVLAEYVASAVRYAAKDTKMQWPEDTIIVAKSYTELAELDDIIGMKIYIMDMPSSFDFFVAFKAENVEHSKLQKAFLEYLEMYNIEN